MHLNYFTIEGFVFISCFCEIYRVLHELSFLYTSHSVLALTFVASSTTGLGVFIFQDEDKALSEVQVQAPAGQTEEVSSLVNE